MSAPDTDALMAFAERLADAAGAVARRHFRVPAAVAAKPDASPVTSADREGEAAMRALIEAEFPDHGIIGEEFPPTRARAHYLWLLDPIDGTRSFIMGRPLFGTLVALLHEGRPILGLVDHPITAERWLGAPGRGTTLNGRAARARACPGVAEAFLHTTSPDAFAGPDAMAFARLRARAGLTTYGAECYAYGLLASGFLDLVIETGLGPDDYFALAAVVEGAGGVTTDWSGARLDLHSDGRVLAAGDRRAHAEALALLAA